MICKILFYYNTNFFFYILIIYYFYATALGTLRSQIEDIQHVGLSWSSIAVCVVCYKDKPASSLLNVKCSQSENEVTVSGIPLKRLLFPCVGSLKCSAQTQRNRNLSEV